MSIFASLNDEQRITYKNSYLLTGDNHVFRLSNEGSLVFYKVLQTLNLDYRLNVFAYGFKNAILK